MLVSEFLSISDFDPDTIFLLRFEDLDITEVTFYGSLDKYCDFQIIFFTINSDFTYVLELRCVS